MRFATWITTEKDILIQWSPCKGVLIVAYWINPENLETKNVGFLDSMLMMAMDNGPYLEFTRNMYIEHLRNSLKQKNERLYKLIETKPTWIYMRTLDHLDAEVNVGKVFIDPGDKLADSMKELYNNFVNEEVETVEQFYNKTLKHFEEHIEAVIANDDELEAYDDTEPTKKTVLQGKIGRGRCPQ
jgi:hypothetical protein